MAPPPFLTPNSIEVVWIFKLVASAVWCKVEDNMKIKIERNPGSETWIKIENKEGS